MSLFHVFTLQHKCVLRFYEFPLLRQPSLADTRMYFIHASTASMLDLSPVVELERYCRDPVRRCKGVPACVQVCVVERSIRLQCMAA